MQCFVQRIYCRFWKTPGGKTDIKINTQSMGAHSIGMSIFGGIKTRAKDGNSQGYQSLPISMKPLIPDIIVVLFIKALQGGEEESPEPEPEPKPSLSPPKPAPRRPSPNGSGSSKSPQKGASGDVQVVSDRLELYKQAVRQAEEAGEGAKARRYKRSITTLEQVQCGKDL